jgi:hypothetical protein
LAKAIGVLEAIMARENSMKRPAIASLSIVALLLAGSIAVGAQSMGEAPHAPSFAKLPDSAIAKFKANPQGLLTTYASAGLPLSTQVRSLVLTDPSLVETLIAVAKGANDAQEAAIGAGLAEAARVLAATDPTLAAKIQAAVAQSGLASLITAFVASSNATQTTAVGGEGGGGGGSGGGTGGVGASTGSNSGANAGSGSFGATNGASAFGSLSGASGGGFSSSTNQSTSPSKSSI